MATMTIPELSVETRRVLEQRAAEHGNTAESEARIILEEVLRVKPQKGLGTQLREIVERHGVFDLETYRDRSPAESATIE